MTYDVCAISRCSTKTIQRSQLIASKVIERMTDGWNGMDRQNADFTVQSIYVDECDVCSCAFAFVCRKI